MPRSQYQAPVEREGEPSFPTVGPQYETNEPTNTGAGHRATSRPGEPRERDLKENAEGEGQEGALTATFTPGPLQSSAVDATDTLALSAFLPPRKHGQRKGGGS